MKFMNTARLLRRLLLCLLTLSTVVQLSAVEPARGKGGAFAVSYGNGSVAVFWVPPIGSAAAAWLVTDDSGHVWLKHVAPNEQPFLSALSSEDAERMTAMLTDTQRGDSLTQSNALAILCARAFSDFAFAQAAGLARVLDAIPTGAHSYTARALDAQGNAIGDPLVTVAVDSATASPLAPPPTNLRAQVAQPPLTFICLSLRIASSAKAPAC
jgi:hypothetical protein